MDGEPCHQSHGTRSRQKETLGSFPLHSMVFRNGIISRTTKKGEHERCVALSETPKTGKDSGMLPSVHQFHGGKVRRK